MNQTVAKLINEQINKEFYSAYLYLDFANYYAQVGLDGFENWYKVQAQEERDHALLFYQYMQNNNEAVTFEAVAKPEWERGDHMTPLKKALEHESYVTASIDAIYCRRIRVRGLPRHADAGLVHQGARARRRRTPPTSSPKWSFSRDSKGLYMLNSELKADPMHAPSLVLD